MQLKKITAIVRTSVAEGVEGTLRQMRVKGVSVSRVKGFGEYANLLGGGWLSEHVRIEVYAAGDAVDPIVEAIMESAHTGMSGDGMVAVTPVETIFRIRTKSVAQPEEI